jgi:hypothetical protein
MWLGIGQARAASRGGLISRSDSLTSMLTRRTSISNRRLPIIANTSIPCLWYVSHHHLLIFRSKTFVDVFVVIANIFNLITFEDGEEKIDAASALANL